MYLFVQSWLLWCKYLLFIPVFFQWKLHLFELEEELKIDPQIKYALYQVAFSHIMLMLVTVILYDLLVAVHHQHIAEKKLC